MIPGMKKQIAGWMLGAVLAGPAWGHSLTVSGLFDGDDGRSLTAIGRFAPLDSLSLAASVGQSRSKFQDSDEVLSGNSFGVSADVDFSAFFANASAQRWRDSGELRSDSLHGELGWMSEQGIAIAGLVTHRAMQVTYTSTLLGQTREREIDFKGSGIGADVSYFGPAWTAGVRFLDYAYGSNVERVRAIIESSNTTRFPRLQQLISSMATRAAGAPDREMSVVVGRQFEKFALSADVQWQRDALTTDETRSAGLTLGFTPLKYLGVDLSAGASKTDEADTIGWAGLALTLRSSRAP
jgi:hypothetical protein